MKARPACLALLALLGAGPAQAAEDPEPAPTGDALPAQERRSAEDIYARVLENRFEASVQEMTLVSSGPGGDAQPIQLHAWFRHYPEGSEVREQDVLAKSLVRYLAPRDYKGVGYLILRRTEGAHDQFVYAPSRRKVRRFNLGEEEIAGTDFSLEDIVPRELEDAEYERAEDALVEGESCFVIEARMKPEVHSQYSRFVMAIEKRHHVPLETRYWDLQDVEVKLLSAPLASIEEVDGIWIARERTARNLLERTETRLRVERVASAEELSDRIFSQRWLSSKRPPPAPWDEAGD